MVCNPPPSLSCANQLPVPSDRKTANTLEPKELNGNVPPGNEPKFLKAPIIYALSASENPLLILQTILRALVGSNDANPAPQVFIFATLFATPEVSIST